MLKLEKKGSQLEIRLKPHRSRKKLIKAFVIALCCHLLFFALFFPFNPPEMWQQLSPPIIAYVDEAPEEE